MNVIIEDSLLRFDSTADRDKAITELMLYENYDNLHPVFSVQLGDGGCTIAFPFKEKIQNAARLLAVIGPA